MSAQQERTHDTLTIHDLLYTYADSIDQQEFEGLRALFVLILRALLLLVFEEFDRCQPLGAVHIRRFAAHSLGPRRRRHGLIPFHFLAVPTFHFSFLCLRHRRLHTLRAVTKGTFRFHDPFRLFDVNLHFFSVDVH